MVPVETKRCFSSIPSRQFRKSNEAEELLRALDSLTSVTVRENSDPRLILQMLLSGIEHLQKDCLRQIENG